MWKFLAVPLRFLRLLIDYMSDIVYEWLYRDCHTPIPPIRDVLLLDPATVLAEKIRNRSVKASQVVEIYIERIKEVNGILNCVVDTRFEDARRDALAVDELVLRSDPSTLAQEKPFLGVPFTTKDCFAVTGLSWTAGLLARSGARAGFDADTVRNLRDAGAIPLGVTNVSELCMWMESSNRVYGRSNNPYKTNRIVGGSSGGEAGIIASGGSVFGIGSDVGGSIRMPSFFCGIFGHKPSSGIVSNQGQLPVAEGVIDEFLTTGPMCRYARDLIPMLKVLAGRKGLDLHLDEKVNIKQLKVYYMVDDGGNPLVSPVHKDLKKAQMELVSRLENVHRIKTKKVCLRHFRHSFDIWSHKMSSEPLAPPFAAELRQRQGAIQPFRELLKWCLFKMSPHTLPAIGLALLERFIPTASPVHQTMLQKCDELSAELEALLGTDAVLLYPSHATPAPYHGQPIVKTFNWSYTAIFNVLKNPVTQCPLGIGSWGVPVGIQVVAARNMDRLSLAMAAEIEKLFGGWVPPSGVE